MEKKKWKILLVDDEEDEYILTGGMLAEGFESSFSLTWVATYQAGREAILSGAYDAVLMDYDLGARNGIELAREVFAAGSRTPILLLTGRGSYEVDVEAMQSGLSDYINKNRVTSAFLERSIRFAIERQRAAQELQAARDDLEAANQNLAARNAELEQANAALFMSEERFRLATSAIKECVWDWDVVNKRAWRSEQYNTVFGPYPEGVSSEINWWRDRIHPDDRERVLNSLALSEVNNDPHWECEYRFRRGDGTYAPVLDCAAVGFGPDGRRLRATGALQDLTRLKEAEARYRQILETTYEGIWSMQADGTTDYINERGASILGFPRHEILGRRAEDFLYLEEGQPAFNQPDPLYSSAGSHSEYCVRTKTGEEVWISASHSPILNDDARYTGAMIMFTDITERKQTERALAESKQRFQLALASVPLVVFTADRDLRYTWVYNPPQGLEVEEMLWRRDDEIALMSEVENLIAAKQQVIETGRGMQKEIKLRMGEQAFYYVYNMEPALDDEGRVTGLVAAALDVTEHRHLELHHRESVTRMEVQRRLSEQREKERQEIARNIHDGPLQGLIALIFNLQYARAEIKDEDAASAFEQAMAQLKMTVRELREVCNELRPPVMIQNGLARAIRIHAEDFREKHKHIALKLDLFEDGSLLPEHACLSLYRIYQESMNNVVRHAEASCVDVVYYRQGQTVVLEVRDNGKGLDFTANWADLARSNHFGLAGIKERVEAVQGSLNLISAAGEGTIVQVVIPIP